MIVMDLPGRAGSTTLSESFYRRIVADIRGRVASGEWPPGSRLPSTRELVELYRSQFASPTLAHTTVRHAVGLLIELGELRGQQGLGVFVVESTIREG